MREQKIIPNEYVWAYKATWTQSNAGGGNIIVDFRNTIGDAFMILSVTTGLDDYAAGRTVQLLIMDNEATPVIVRRLASVSVDNQNVSIPAPGDAIAANVNSDSTFPILVTGSDALTIIATSLVQNETLTITVRLLCRQKLPTIIRSRSSGTVNQQTEIYNRLV